MTFHDLGLSDELLRAVTDAGYSEPTAIQRQAIPAVLMSRDLIGVAQTGTGKTAAFVLPMIDILGNGRARARMPRSLILAPTRELAAQVAENFEKYGRHHKLSMALLIGGVSFGDQDAALMKGVDVLIATPGRFLDQFERGKILLSGVEILVIDEADRMLDMGFIPDVERICSLLSAKRQTLLFSATMPGPVKKLADRFLTNPKLIEVSRAASTNADIAQSLVMLESRDKRSVLRELLRVEKVEPAIVFCNRKRDVRDLYDNLKRSGFRVGQIHGDMEQPDRLKELARFKADEIGILVASDVAARGLDIKGVSHVFNFDVPYNADDYVHRIGRTGRAGAKGIAITLATPEEAEKLADIEKLIGQPIPRAGAPAPHPANDRGREEAGSRTRDRRRSGTAARSRVDEREPRRGERGARESAPNYEESPAAEAAPGRAARAPRETAPRYDDRPAPAERKRRSAPPPAFDGRWEGPIPGFLQVSAREAA
ncbi:MAG: DEAD/DEAH box helicase [Sphingomonadaceae bacterium]|nr:DEAD/DEAH box helicase [Sphingomonadaceae bacterium]